VRFSNILLCTGLLAFGLTGCTTPQARLETSPAILESRAAASQHRAGLQAVAKPCAAGSVAIDSPITIDFAWESADLANNDRSHLDDVVARLPCSRQTAIAITAYSDHHLSLERQRDLATRRGAAIRAYLTDHGVTPQISVVVEPAGPKPVIATPDVLAIEARGQGW
jgi:outer membrane protein OmpA-like peptidoglycan-associated protein